MQPYSETLSVSWNPICFSRNDRNISCTSVPSLAATSCTKPFRRHCRCSHQPLKSHSRQQKQNQSDQIISHPSDRYSNRRLINQLPNWKMICISFPKHMQLQEKTGRTAAAQDVAAVVAGAVAASQGSQRQVQQTLNWLTERYGSDSMNLQQQLRQAEQDRQLRRRSETTSSISSLSLSSGPVSRDQFTSRSVTPQSPQLSPAGHATGQMSAHMASVSIQPEDQILIESVQQMIADIVAGRRPGTIRF